MSSPTGDGEPEEGGSPGVRPFLAVPLGAADEVEPGGTPRPFVVTSGRVAAPDRDLGLETRVTARTTGNGRLSFEHAAIVALCAQPMSVAEISARLHLHLGVTRVLVGDLRAAGYLEVEPMDVDEATDMDTVRRVFDGLRSLS